MLVHQNFVEYRGCRLHYAKAGNGPVALLAFHGFGQDLSVYEEWMPQLANDYTLFSFDLFFHGQSQWPRHEALEKSDWKEIMNLFFKKEDVNIFAVAGYSLGGKFALATLECFPERVQKVFLLAPDGVHPNLWYNLATYPFLLRQFFKSMVLKPGRFYNLMKVLSMLGLVNKAVLRFAASQMDTEDKRRRVYFSWVYFRPLKFSMKEMAGLINEFNIPVTFIMGKFDKVIPPEQMNPLLKRLHQKQLRIIDAGHNDLIGGALTYL